MHGWRINLVGSFLLFLPVVSAAQSVRTSQLVLEPEYGIRLKALNAVSPEYPEEARAAGAQGLVIVAVHFETNGDYAGAQVLASPHPAISRAVIAAIEKWRFDPHIVTGGEPAREQGELRFRYVIEDERYSVELLPTEQQKKYSPQYKKFDMKFRSSWPEQKSKN